MAYNWSRPRDNWANHRAMAGITNETPWSIQKQVWKEWQRLDKTDLSDPLVVKKLREMRIRLEQEHGIENQRPKPQSELVQLRQKVSELEATIKEQRAAILTQQKVEELKDEHYAKLHEAYTRLLNERRLLTERSEQNLNTASK